MPKSPLLERFDCSKVAGRAKAHCQNLADLALDFDRNIPDGQHKESALSKLLEAKEAVIKACKP